MNLPFQVPDETLKKQEQVSDPAVSAWVSANAGAGKTTVLVRRVIRLLLAGNAPSRILCLTFTKAAAANMANKVLQTLSRWVRLDDAALDAEIRKLSPLAPTPALRAAARRLFAQALETPGGLKVQTIHAFCDRVLHQFPIEAGIQAGFEVLDEVQEADLLRRAREAVLIEASHAADSALGKALAIAVASASDSSFQIALAEAVRGRRKLQRLLDDGGVAAIAAALNIPPDETPDAVVQDILLSPHLPHGEWAHAAAVLATLGGNAAACGARLHVAAAASNEESAAEAYLDFFFTGKGDPRADSGFGAAAAQRREPDLFARIFRERDRLIPLRDRLLAARALERTSALLSLAGATIEKFEAEKRARGALDYSDLVEKTADMLADTGSAWVLYKLDGGIDHVLIDEAQDTSPEQWGVIERLTEEFFAGRGAREDRGRTIFVVGDDKQSIFSFQGADPQLFGEMRGEFERRVVAAERQFLPRELLLSFRSAPGVLQAVDAVFARPEAHRGLSSGEERATIHEAIRSSAPALVELWNVEEPENGREEGLAWDAPLDARSEASPVVKLAQRIARAVKLWTEGGLTIEDRDTRQLRTPHAGDVIVLVRRRGPLFDAVLQALKKANIPVAGADRLMLAEHIAVMDLMALGDALLLERDDLALASVLKSPLFGLSEEDLFELAHRRSGTLAASLAAHTGAAPRFAEAADKLSRWRGEAALLRPFDFFSRVLGRDGGRSLMLARLGQEAADAIDEFLAQALAYEQTETPTLAGFLHFLRRAGTEVKRDLEVESDAVRVMTVHGAKGLEAPIVIVADTTSIPDGRNTRLHDIPGSPAFLWAGKREQDSRRERAAREAAADFRAAEYRRLLYVALTRAADALIVCGSKGKNRIDEGCWYQLVEEALSASEPDLVEVETNYGAVRRWRPEPLRAAGAQPQMPVERAQTEPWLTVPAPPAAPAAKRIVPSQLDPDDAPVSAFARVRPSVDPRLRGDLVHRLLHRLPDVPVAQWREAALHFLRSMAPEIDAATSESIASEAIGVVEHPALRDLFGANSRGEVEFLAHAADVNEEISGRIDRLAVLDDCVIVADFKTGAPPAGGAPGNYLRQLAIYARALAGIYPGRAMRCLLVWTESGTVQEITAETLAAASSG